MIRVFPLLEIKEAYLTQRNDVASSLMKSSFTVNSTKLVVYILCSLVTSKKVYDIEKFWGFWDFLRFFWDFWDFLGIFAIFGDFWGTFFGKVYEIFSSDLDTTLCNRSRG